MLPKVHPIAKTATELRRSIHRLEIFKQLNPNDPDIDAVNELIKDLESARSHVPGHLLDVDLVEE